MSQGTGANLTHEELVVACRNVGVDLRCARCAEVFYCGSSGHDHEPTCETKTRPRGEPMIAKLARAVLAPNDVSKRFTEKWAVLESYRAALQVLDTVERSFEEALPKNHRQLAEMIVMLVEGRWQG